MSLFNRHSTLRDKRLIFNEDKNLKGKKINGHMLHAKMESKFQNDWLKVICFGTFLFIDIPRNFILYLCVKEIKNLKQQWNFLSDMHQN